MKHITIQAVQNGFIVTETMPFRMAETVVKDPFVFESFESMTAWLNQNLEKPKTGQEAGIISAEDIDRVSAEVSAERVRGHW